MRHRGNVYIKTTSCFMICKHNKFGTCINVTILNKQMVEIKKKKKHIGLNVTYSDSEIALKTCSNKQRFKFDCRTQCQPFVYIFIFDSVSPIQLGHYHHLGMWSWPNQFWQCCSQIIIQIGANNYTVVRSRYCKRRCLAILPEPFHK